SRVARASCALALHRAKRAAMDPQGPLGLPVVVREPAVDLAAGLEVRVGEAAMEAAVPDPHGRDGKLEWPAIADRDRRAPLAGQRDLVEEEVLYPHRLMVPDLGLETHGPALVPGAVVVLDRTH